MWAYEIITMIVVYGLAGHDSSILIKNVWQTDRRLLSNSGMIDVQDEMADFLRDLRKRLKYLTIVKLRQTVTPINILHRYCG